jgi:plasmid maintenance system antidote protein VapI
MGARSARARARGRSAPHGQLTLAQYCDLEKLTDRDLARLFGIDPSHANRLRRRVARAGPDLAYRISAYTRGKVPLEQLLFVA